MTITTYYNGKNVHYCKHCDDNFRTDFAEKETGDFFLVCPWCEFLHYRRIENGIAVHCELSKRKSEPIEVRGR